MKIRLVSRHPLTLHSQWLQSIVEPEFDMIVGVEPAVSDCYYTNQWDRIAVAHASNGGRVVLDCLWEASTPIATTPWHCHVLQNWSWFWYQESLWYRHLGYHEFQPSPDWTHHALMPMRRQKTARDYIVKQLGTELDRFIWSYQDQGRNLPNSGDPNDWNTQRLFQPEWYNATALSLVVESDTSSSEISATPFVTEKTFKPIAFKHPFVVAGPPGTLAFLHKLGFETFENLWDESYDRIGPWQTRCNAVIRTVLDYTPRAWDAETQRRLEHNHARFFDQQLVTNLIQQEIIEPLKQYAQT